jgi:HK97 family phage portal protein
MLAELLFAETRTSLENPSTSLSNPAAWLYDTLGASTSSSGVTVSKDTALMYAAVYRATALISGDVASLPLLTYKRLDDGGKDRDKSHPAYRLLRHEPNPYTTAYDFMRAMTANALLHGNAYAWIERRDGGRYDGDVKALYLLDPATTFPARENDELLYVTSLPYNGGTERRKLLADNVLHLRGLGCDGLAGYSVIHKARDSMGRGLGAGEYSSRFFKNGAKPGVVIEFPNPMKLEAHQEFLRQWNEMHQGLDNINRTAIITNGGKVNPFTINARDSQLLEMRQFEIREIANWFGVPPHKLGDSSRTAYNSLEQENRSYLQESLNPWLKAWETQCWKKLLRETEKDNDTHVIEFVRDSLESNDTKSVVETVIMEVNNGLLTPNEGRAIRNRPRFDGGDEMRRPLNLEVVKPESDEPEGEGDPATDTPEGAAAAGELQWTGLNGSQIQELVAICKDVSQGILPAEGAKLLINLSFPLLDDAEVIQLVNVLAAFEPPPLVPGAPQPGAPVAPAPTGDTTIVIGTEPEPRNITALRQLLADALGRSARRLGLHARKASKKPDRFIDWLDGVEAEHREVIEAALKPVVAVCGIHDAQSVAGNLLECFRSEMLAIADVCTAGTLANGVQDRMTDWESSIPASLVDTLFTSEDTSNGT